MECDDVKHFPFQELLTTFYIYDKKKFYTFKILYSAFIIIFNMLTLPNGVVKSKRIWNNKKENFTSGEMIKVH